MGHDNDDHSHGHGHHHHDHDHHHPGDHDHHVTFDGGEFNWQTQAVDSPVDKTYDNERTFIREVSSKFFDLRDVWAELRDPEKRVIKGKDIPLKSKTENDMFEGSAAWGKSYVRPWKGISQTFTILERVLAPETDDKRHMHQSEAIMYVLEGEGYEIHDGKEYTWEEGDVVIIPGGTVHSHHSAHPDEPCRLLYFNPRAFYIFTHLMYEGTVKHTPGEPAKDPEWTPPWNYAPGSEAYSVADSKQNERLQERYETEQRHTLNED